MFKSVRYAYPTSDIAILFDMDKSGCWFLRTGRDNADMQAIYAYKTQKEAVEAADHLPYIYDRWSMHDA